MLKMIKTCSVRHAWFALALLAMLVSGCGCNISSPASDPLADFHWSSLKNLDSNKAILDDCNNYIDTLSPEEKKSPSLHFYENKTGEHAVDIIIGVNGRWWRHILIYDRDNKRVQKIKYATGYYAS